MASRGLTNVAASLLFIAASIGAAGGGQRPLASGVAPVDAPGVLLFLGVGEQIPAAILRAGVSLPVLGSIASTTEPHSNVCSARNIGDSPYCSSDGMPGGSTGLIECSVLAREELPFGNPNVFACSARIVTGGSSTAECSAASKPGGAFCSVLTGSLNMACSTHKETGGTGQATCSVYGGQGGSATCSVESSADESSSCSSYGGSSDSSEHCSAESGSSSQDKCSVVEGSGNTCTASNGSANSTCSTTQGASGQCSSFTSGGAQVDNGDLQGTCQ